MTTDGWAYCFEQLARDDVSELQANGPQEFFIKVAGKRVRLDLSYESDEAYAEALERELVPVVRSPFTYKRNGYLFEGPMDMRVGGTRLRGRVHVVLSPAADRPQVTIAKKTASLVTLDAIASKGSLAEEMKNFLIACVKTRRTIVFSGGTGAGKTTMLEACTKYIGPSVRIGVAEDTPELDLSQENVTYLHSVPWRPGLDPNDVATLAWAVQQFQRQRLDRAIVGETRGAEFAQFLVAANSGMDGSMTTIHADEPSLCLAKMTNFALKGSERQPIRAVNSEIASALDVIVQLIILPDGRHKVSAIQEITDTVSDKEDARITTARLYYYDEENNSFVKDNVPTDKLRGKLARGGVDYVEHFGNTRTGAVLRARGDAAPGGGLPRRPGGGLPTPRQGG